MASEISMHSQSDDSETETPVTTKRGLGRERGRPLSRKGRGRRGRGRGRRGTRQQDAGPSRVGEVAATLQARKQRIKDQVDSMPEADVRLLLEKVLEKQPSLIFDILEPPQPSGGYHPSRSDSAPNWCLCLRCREMPTDAEKICCQKAPDNCLSQTPDMEMLVLDEAVLAIARFHRQDILALPGEDDLAKGNRHTAYRQFVLWQHGRLGAGVRMVIPSCCIWRIRDKFPDPFGQYTGFKATRLG